MNLSGKRKEPALSGGGLCWNGSFTIEAAVVVPFIMLIFLAVIDLAFYVYDRVTVTAAAQYAVLEHAERSLTGTAQPAGIREGLERRLLASKGTSLTVSGNAQHCEGEGTTAFQVPLLMIEELTSGTLRTIHAEVQGNAFDGRKKLLLYKSICDGIADVLPDQ